MNGSVVEIKPGTVVDITRTDGVLMELKVIVFDGQWIAGKDRYGHLHYIPFTSITVVTKLTKEAANGFGSNNW